MLKTLTRLYYARLSRKNYREFERGYADTAAHNLRKNYREFERGYADTAAHNLRKLPDLIRNNTGTLRAEPYLCDNPYEDGARTACNDYRLLTTLGGDGLQDALKREQVLVARLSDIEKQVEELQSANRQLQSLQLHSIGGFFPYESLRQGLATSHCKNALGSVDGCIGGIVGSSDQDPKD